MARKKIEPISDTSDTSQAQPDAPKPKSPRARAKKPAPEAAPATAPTQRPRIGAKPVAEPESKSEPVAVETKKPRPTRRAAAKKQEEPALFEVESPKPAKRRTAAKKEPPSDPEPVAKATKPTRARTPKAQPADESLVALDAEARALNVEPPTWRPRTSAPKRAPAARAPAAGADVAGGDAAPSDEDERTAGRRPRRRRGRGRRTEGEEQEGMAAEEAAAVEAPAERAPQPSAQPSARPEPPPIPSKPAIPTPEDAPQIVLRDGVPTLVRNHRVYPPLLFFGSASDERRSDTVLDEMKQAGDAGVHLHSHLIEFEVDLDAVNDHASLAAYLLNKTLEIDPEAQVLFRLVFVATRGWHERFPEAKFTTADGGIAEPSVCDDAFWGLARECLSLFSKKLRMLEKRDHVLGLHLERGEWFFADGWGYDTSRAAERRFRSWARTRYLNDRVALRAAWFDGDADFDTLRIPEYQEPASEPKFVRSARKERPWVDYHLFLSDATVERIGDLAYAAKEASDGYLLVGVSYGYTFEWSHPASGHLSLGKLLRDPEIDFICGPPSYKTREPGGAAPFPGPIDSFALNGKLSISEEDFKTAIGQGTDHDDFNPVIKTPQALENVHWRGAGSALAHSSGMCWMDLWGNGWLKSHGIWERAGRVLDALVRRMAAPATDPELAVFIDERALGYLVDQKAFSLLVQNVRESALRAGISAGFYLLSDLAHREHFPESKLYVFLNAWDLRPELRAAIKTRLQRDNKVLFWLYAAGLFESGRESLERAREVTGIALKPQPFHSKSGTTILNRRHPLCEAFQDRTIIGGIHLEPSYFAIPEDATVLGEYSQTGLPSFVVKEFHYPEDPTSDWTSVFLGEPVVTPALIRALGQMAGVHVWNYQEDVVHVRPPFLTVHCTGTGQRTIALPDKWSVYDVTHAEWVVTDSSSLRFTAADGSTHLFLVGMKSEIEALLSANPDDVLRMETLPPKPDNTVHFDSVSFDVPIMKLGEFMEGGTDDDISEDFLLRPVVTEESEAELETTTTGRRRKRRRRRGGDRGGSEPDMGGGHATLIDKELDVHVVFRRRE